MDKKKAVNHFQCGLSANTDFSTAVINIIDVMNNSCWISSFSKAPEQLLAILLVVEFPQSKGILCHSLDVPALVLNFCNLRLITQHLKQQKWTILQVFTSPTRIAL